MDGLYISGKADMLPSRARFIYLPRQASRDHSRGSLATSGASGTTMARRRGTADHLQDMRTSSGSGYRGGYQHDAFTLHTDEEQTTSRQHWDGFARGGVVQDDDARFLRSRAAFDSTPPRRPLTSDGCAVLGEQVRQTSCGRSRWVHKYQSSGSGVASGSDFQEVDDESEADENNDGAKEGTKFGKLIDF
jgi:hypothetical protein